MTFWIFWSIVGVGGVEPGSLVTKDGTPGYRELLQYLLNPQTQPQSDGPSRCRQEGGKVEGGEIVDEGLHCGGEGDIKPGGYFIISPSIRLLIDENCLDVCLHTGQ